MGARRETIAIETWDVSTGFFKTPVDKAIPANRPGFDRSPPMVNPIAGPVYIEGAERGDVLVACIEEVEWQIIRGWRWGRSAVRWVNPRVGRNYRANIPPRFFRTHRAPVAPCRMAHCTSDSISWPITPFIGASCTAPDREVYEYRWQGAWGGNLDMRDAAAGGF